MKRRDFLKSSGALPLMPSIFNIDIITEKQWSEMTRKEKKVALAKDLLERIKSHKIKLSSGTGYFIGFSTRVQQSAVEFLQKHCTVCARGGLMISHFIKDPNKKLEERCGYKTGYGSNSQNLTKEVLSDTFYEEELELIEVAFEHDKEFPGYGDGKGVNDDDLLDMAVVFGLRYEDDYDRLKAICKNIIENDGSFCP